MESNAKPQCRKKELVVQDLKSEILIYDLLNNKAYCLNETAALVWGFCDGEKSVTAIRQSMAKRLKQPVPEELVLLALDQLKKENLIEKSYEETLNLKGLSRRTAIRRAGLASVIALPLISSLVAPLAANAQSISVPACPTEFNGFGGFAGDSCRCAPGTPSGTICGGGGVGDNGACLTGCTCTSDGVEPVGGDITTGICS